MLVYLMRHGEAVSPSEWSGDDAKRPLSPMGLVRLNSAAEEMARLKFSASKLLTSPLIRAKQTTKIIEAAIPSLKSIECPELGGGATLALLKALLEKYKTETSVWMIGHMPDLAIFGSRISGQASVIEKGLSPGEMMALEIDLSGPHWGDGKILWTRSSEDWKKVRSL